MDTETITYLLNLLRQGTVKWPGRSQCLKRARKKVLVRNSKEGKPIYKLHWQCAICKSWTEKQNDMEVDHIVEIGSFTGNFDDYIKKMYCGQDNLQALCVSCHKKKTLKFNNARLKYNRRGNGEEDN
jgi:5-methylcytosine-specific restriction endonuclease McrA